MTIPFPPGQYATILADPPWDFRARSSKGEGRSAKQHYGVMPTADICALPVGALAAPDSCLFLWATGAMFPHALQVMEAWGFDFKTVAFVWVKTNKDGMTPFTGMGFWTRQNAEYVLMGTKGRPKRLSAAVKQVVMASRFDATGRKRAHSEKPYEVHRRIQALVKGPYVELFARREYPGWAVWGDELPEEVIQASGRAACCMEDELL